MRLLIVEDDAALCRRLKADLARAGFAVDTAGNGVDGEFMGSQEPYDVIVLDLGLPGRPGLEVLKRWRAGGNHVPVIILTARDAWHEKVEGFKAGGDDYLAKPFHTEELIARITALLRRTNAKVGGRLSLEDLTLDEERQCLITPEGRSVELSGVEFRLLRYFMMHPNAILSKSRLTEHVYDFDSEKESNVIEVYVNRLRQKIGKDRIETRRGQGYVLRVPD
ncbi:MAG: response regulator transcription factor [Candidatus Manganitrophaceae bacterium]|nr:MAG: response regulator transcription factor [Candidatus Manganitrophaceae bacterium]